MSKPRTLYDKIWDDHVIETQSAASSLIYIDRHLVHEVTSPQAFEGFDWPAARCARRRRRSPSSTTTSRPPTARGGIDDPESRLQVEELAENAREFGIEYYDEFDPRQGVVHIIGPEQGFTLPGTTIVCGDSHTSTHGAFGALAHGIGTSEVEHVLATQTLIQAKAKNMRVTVDGALPPGVTAKDIILAIIGEIGTAGGTGHVIEYAGEAIRALSMEGRMTVCNMSIEGGARAGMIAPDEKTFAYLKGRPKSPKGALWDQAVAYWETLRSDEGAHFDHEVRLDAAKPAADRLLGHEPAGRRVDQRQGAASRGWRDRAEARLDPALARIYGAQGRREDHRHRNRPRLHRLLHQRANRGFARRRRDRRAIKVSERVNAMVVPGSGLVKAQAEAEGLDGIFHAAGFEWREPGCSMCLAMNPTSSPRRALRLDLEPQFRGPPGLQGPHPSRFARDGRGGRDRRPVRRRQGVALRGHESRRSAHRRKRDRRELRPRVGAGRAERQQGRERGRIQVRRAPPPSLPTTSPAAFQARRLAPPTRA